MLRPRDRLPSLICSLKKERMNPSRLFVVLLYVWCSFISFKTYPELALESGHTSIVSDFIRRKGVDCKISEKLLLISVEINNAEIVGILVADGVDVNTEVLLLFTMNMVYILLLSCAITYCCNAQTCRHHTNAS